MTSWRTANNRRRRLPWILRPRYLGVFDDCHAFVVSRAMYRDLCVGLSITKDGKRVDHADFFVEPPK